MRWYWDGGTQVILEWRPDQVFWDAKVDDIVVVPKGAPPASRVFVSLAGSLRMPVLVAVNAADTASDLEQLSDKQLVWPQAACATSPKPHTCMCPDRLPSCPSLGTSSRGRHGCNTAQRCAHVGPLVTCCAELYCMHPCPACAGASGRTDAAVLVST